MKVEYNDFVVAYATSETLSDLMKTTGLSAPTIRTRVKALRKAGVNLPDLKKATSALDKLEVKQLNDLFVKHHKRFEKAI